MARCAARVAHAVSRRPYPPRNRSRADTARRRRLARRQSRDAPRRSSVQPLCRPARSSALGMNSGARRAPTVSPKALADRLIRAGEQAHGAGAFVGERAPGRLECPRFRGHLRAFVERRWPGGEKCLGPDTPGGRAATPPRRWRSSSPSVRPWRPKNGRGKLVDGKWTEATFHESRGLPALTRVRRHGR